jgi:hypothetical protein
VVEFALVIPILLILAVALGDFGRIFATSVLLESAARKAAEVGATEYIVNRPGKDASPPVPLSDPAPTGTSSYYRSLHAIVAKAVCAEAQELPSVSYDSVNGTCTGMPFVMVCVHDGQDTECGTEAFGAIPPLNCTGMNPGPADQHAGSPAPRWVEVRVCYRFTSLVTMPLMPFGDFWLERSRTFAIPCYFALGTADECG